MGVPTTVFSTTGFDRLGAMLLTGLSEDMAQIVGLPHPLVDRGDAEVTALVERHADTIRAWAAAAEPRQ